jgi:hypothetical protein
MKTALAMLAAMMLSTGASFGQGKIKVFTEGENKSAAPVRKGDLNQIKFNPWLIPRGVLAVQYERILNDKFSMEGGLGVTVFADMIFEVNHALRNPGKLDALGNGAGMTASSNSGMGPAISGAISFWPKGNKDFDGIYLRSQMSFRQYNLGTYTFTTDIPDGQGGFIAKEQPFRQGYSIFDWGLLFGRQKEKWSSSFLSDAYIGLGFRVANYTLVSSEERSIPDITMGTRTYTDYTVGRTTRILPQLYMGYAFGIPF